ncbi:MAG TPA: hypothetical protein P5514_10955 [Bacteroidales bacterium]|nr:hypothetical protein [Bacteroidales bacterium]
MDNIVKTVAVAVFPDSCDLLLIEEIEKFRVDRLYFPDDQEVFILMDQLHPSCEQSYDSLKTLSYQNDSMDFVFVKIVYDTTLQLNTIFKGYRLICDNDSVQTVKLLNKNSNYQSELIR